MDEGPIGRADDVDYSQGTSGETARCRRGGFCRFLPLHRPPKRSDVRRPHETGRTITKDAADKVEDKAKDVKDRMLGRKTEGPEDHRGAM